MKKLNIINILLLLEVGIFVFAYVKHKIITKTDKGVVPTIMYLAGQDAKISYTEAEQPTYNFLTTAYKHRLRVVPLTVVPSLPDTVRMKKDSSYKKNGVISFGNAFFCEVEGKSFLCSAYHCVDSWQSKFKRIKSYTKKLNTDISLIDYKLMLKDHNDLSDFSIPKLNHYKAVFDFPEYDSVFVRGYFPDHKDGKIKAVFIKGIGFKVFKSNFKHTDRYTPDEMILVRLSKKFVELHGVSGSPVLNSKGEVIGVTTEVYSKISLGKDTATACYLGITTFHH